MPPNIFDYMDAGHYLQDVFRAMKMADPKFSYGRWTQQLGFNNKTLLRLILQGKRKISPKSAAQFGAFLELGGPQAQYFQALIDYSQAANVQQKQALGRSLIQIQRRHFVQTNISPDAGLLQDAYGPILLTMISSAEVALDLAELQSLCGLPLERLRQILATLTTNELIRNENGKFRATQFTFKVADHFGHETLRNYYDYWLHRSVEAIKLPTELRRFRSIQVLLSAEEFAELNEQFNEFVLTNLHRLAKNTLSQRRLYLMNSCLFPVTERM